ncbi:MAG TPA: helix-turn-helix domain-containing protein [Pyrinomonadaceae bacterium]|jgi:cytoskeleton protein RodZ
MSLTLGEKLQQAREARGITISEVAEQTRISGLYLEAIENNDYRTLPGGIFNKGFVKSYARYVGVDEQEALQDYNRLIVEQQGDQADEPKTYKPQVLTDEKRSSSLMTIIFAVVILGLMTWGILALVNYLQSEKTSSVANNTNTNQNANNAVNTNANPVVTAAPALESAKIEFKASGDEVSLTSAVDGGKSISTLVAADKSVVFEPKSNVKLSYATARAQFARLTINGKAITLPNASSKNKVEFEINKENLPQIWQSGQITASDANNSNIGPRPR